MNSAQIINNSSNQAQINPLGDLFGREFIGNDYGFTGNNLFIVNSGGNFLITINKGVAESTDNDALLNDFLNKINSTSDSSLSTSLSAKLLGDDIYLGSFIANLLQNQTSSRYLTFDATSDFAQLKSFLDSTAAQMQNLGIAFGSALTSEQRSNLNAPFISFKKQEIFVKDGNIYNTQIAGSSPEEVYIPTILTPFATTINQETSNIASQNASAIEARNELVIDATQEVRNQAQIKAGTIVIETENFTNELSNQTLTLDAEGNLTYVASSDTNTNKTTNQNTPAITAKDNIFITAKNNFNNNSANINAGNNLVIAAGNNFNVSSNSSGLKSNFNAGNIAINAANANINNLDLGSNSLMLEVDNNLNLQNSNITSNDIYLSNLKGFAKIDNSNIDTNSSLNINAGGNANILASNIKASGLQISSGNNLDINSSNINSSGLTQINSGGSADISGSVINSSNYTTITAKNDFNLTNSSLNAQGLIVDSGANLNINKSNIKTTNDNEDGFLQITAKNNFNLNNSNIDSNTAYISAGNNINLNDNNINTNITSISSGNNTNLIGNNINAADILQIAAGGDLNIATRKTTTNHSSSKTIGRSTQKINSTTTTHSGFNSLSGGNIVLSSGKNTNITAANLNADNTLQIDAGGDLNIKNATNTTNTVTNTATQYDQFFRIKKRRYGRRTLTAHSTQNSQQTSDIASNLSGASILLSSGNNTNITGASLKANNTIQIDAKNNLNIASVNKATTLNAGNIYLNSRNQLSITGTKINTNDLIATAKGQITFRQNQSKTTGVLALINERGFVNSASENTTSKLTSLATPKLTSLATSSPANIVYEAGQVENSVGDLVLMTSADIINHGSLIAGGDINLQANNITNSRTAVTTYSGRNFSTTLTGEALIQAGGSVFMKATNDINNYAGTIIARDGDITLLAGGNVNIGSVELKNRTVRSGGRKKRAWYSVVETTTNVGSNISAGSNIIIKAGNDSTVQGSNAFGNINITGSNLTSGTNATTSATNGSNIIMNAANNLNIKSSVDSFNSIFAARKHYSATSRTTNNKSNLIAGSNSTNGNIYINTLNIDETTGSILIPTSLALRDISNDVNIIGSNLTAKDNIAIAAGNNITIASAQDTFDSVSRFKSKKRSSSSEVRRTTQITSDLNAENGSIELNALGVNENLLTGSTTSNGGNINIVASNLTAANNASIIAANNLNITSAEDSYYYHTASSKKGSFDRSRSYSLTIDELTNKQSTITVGGGIVASSGNDTNITASDLTANTGDINLSATNNINIVSAANTYLRDEQSSKQGLTIMKSSINIQQDLINIASNLNAGSDININSGADTNLIGTKLTAANDIAINAGGELNIYAVADQHYRYQNSTKTRSFATIAKYTGLSLAMDSMNSMMDLVDMASFGVGPLTSIARGGVGYYQNLAEGDFNSKSSTKVTNDITYQKASLEAGNNLSLIANDNINLIGVDLSATNLASGNGTITSINGDVAIVNVKDSHQENSQTHKSKTTFTSLAAGAVRNYFLAASTIVTGATILKNPFDKQETYKENEAAMKDTLKKSQTQISQITDETIIASDLNFAGNLNISAGNNTNITSSNLNAGGDLNINSANTTTISTAAENDSTFTLTEKKSPNIFAAFSNGFTQLFAAAMPDFTFWEAKKGKGKDKAKTQRENDSLDHNPHRIDFNTATADKSKTQAMVEGYTISNNDPDEMAYDLDLTKITTQTKTNIASNLSAGNDLNITSNNQNSSGGSSENPTNIGNLIIASNLAANNNINLNSLNGSTIITSAQDESFRATSTVDQTYNDISFSADRGRLAVNSNSKILEEDTKTTTKTQISSQLFSGNNININTQDNIDILSSNLNSNNQINLNSLEGNINILANSNTILSEKEIREGTLTLSAGIGHVAVDVAYAEYDLIKATRNVADAKKNLNHIETLHKQGKADDEALSDAKTNLAIAGLNLLLADLKVAAASAKAAESTKTLGFYADATLTRTGQKTNMNSSNIDEIGSNLLATNSININSGSLLVNPELNRDLGNTNIKGSIQSNNGDINITSANNTNITALKSTSSSSTKSEGFSTTLTLASSANVSTKIFEQLINNLSASIAAGSNKSNSDSRDTTYTNTILSAQNGNLKINSGNDTTIKGANLLAQDLTINTQNNLIIESLQNSTHSKSKSKSFNLGAGGNGGGLSSISLGYNSNRSSFDRNWVDDQTTVIGTNSVNINTGNNTKIKGAVVANITNASTLQNNGENIINNKNAIDGGNLTMNMGSLTIENIQDSEKQKSSGFGLSTNIGVGTNSSTTNPGQDKSYYPTGSTTLSLQNAGYIKEQETKATIGSPDLGNPKNKISSIQ